MRSQFSAQTLAEIFRDLFVFERSGVLVLTRDKITKRVHFDRGMIVLAESSLPEEDLGAFLVESGKLSAGALAEARNSIEGTTGASALADMLVRRDLIGRADVAETMRGMVDRIVSSGFAWDQGDARFHEGGQENGLFESDVLITAEVILKGILCMAGFDRICGAMLALDNRLRMRDCLAVPVERLSLSAAQGFILSRVDGNTSLRDLISILPADEEESSSRFVFGLLVLGVLEYDPPIGQGPFRVSDIVKDHADQQTLERAQEQTIMHVYEKVREGNPHEVLAVPPSASHDEIERAYENAKSQISQERVLPRVREKHRSELVVIESRLVEAFLTLTRPSRAKPEKPAPANGGGVKLRDLQVRVEIDKAKSKQEADESNRVADTYYAKGLKCVREGDFHNAIQYGKLAISHNPSDARYYSMIAEAQSRNPETRWQRMAEDNFTRATQLDPWNYEYWLSLGRFYRNQGMNLRAKKQFQEAAKLVPNRPEVLRELASVSPKPSRSHVV